MSVKTIKITYWILTVIFVLFSLFDAIGGLTHMPAGIKGVTHLGYPVYLLDISGIAKLIGAVCIIQTKFKIIKEWAYAGFVISIICAAWSHAAVGDPIVNIVVPIVFLVYLLVAYYFWRQYQQVTSV